MKRHLQIKVCGMRDAENIRQVEALGIDMMGFIFYERSPRYVSAVPDYLPTRCRRVGVFVNASADDIAHKAGLMQLEAVQLHGSETPDLCAALRQRLGEQVQIIKALSARDAASLQASKSYDGTVDLMLFDTPCAGHGGCGESFDWSMLQSYDGQTPFILSGGIGPDSLASILAFDHPKLCGIDLNSRFELAPALKDPTALSQFLSAVR